MISNDEIARKHVFQRSSQKKASINFTIATKTYYAIDTSLRDICLQNLGAFKSWEPR